MNEWMSQLVKHSVIHLVSYRLTVWHTDYNVTCFFLSLQLLLVLLVPSATTSVDFCFTTPHNATAQHGTVWYGTTTATPPTTIQHQPWHRHTKLENDTRYWFSIPKNNKRYMWQDVKFQPNKQEHLPPYHPVLLSEQNHIKPQNLFKDYFI